MNIEQADILDLQSSYLPKSIQATWRNNRLNSQFQQTCQSHLSILPVSHPCTPSHHTDPRCSNSSFGWTYALVSSRLDYANLILYGSPKSQMAEWIYNRKNIGALYRLVNLLPPKFQIHQVMMECSDETLLVYLISFNQSPSFISHPFQANPIQDPPQLHEPPYLNPIKMYSHEAVGVRIYKQHALFYIPSIQQSWQ